MCLPSSAYSVRSLPRLALVATSLATVLVLSACSLGLVPAPQPTPCVGYVMGQREVGRGGQYLMSTVPATEGGVVYVGVAGGEIVALRAGDGTILWQRPDPLVPLDPGGTRIVVVDQGVLIAIGQHRLVRMRASDGTLLSQVERGSVNYGYPPQPTLDNGVLYASDDAGLYALRLSDGDLIWQVPIPPGQVSLGALSSAYPPVSRAIVANGTVYVGTLNGPVVALRASDGTLLWQSFVVPPSARTTSGSQPLPQQPLPLAAAGGFLYVAGGANQPGILLANARDGTVVRPLPSFANQLFIAGVTDGGVLYLTSESATGGMTSAVRLGDSTLLWQADTGSASNAAVGADHGVLLVNSAPLLGVRETDGTILWQYQLRPFGYPAFPAIGSGEVYVSQKGFVDICNSRRNQRVTVTGLSETNGSVLWTRTLNAPAQ
jgi:outer membrane protein assembly factor BamB